MELSDAGIGYKKFALALSGMGLLLTLACGTSAAPVEPSANNSADSNGAPTEPSATSANNNGGILPDSVLTESAAPGVPPDPADAESVPVSYTIGNNVGQRIPDFAITLVDGSTVTLAELLAQRQPTFLFFFETW